jgi:hypothetical protein
MMRKKCGRVIYNFSSQELLGQNVEIYMKALGHSTKSSLLKALGSGGTTIGDTFICVYIEKYFKNPLKNHWTRKTVIYMKAF